MRYVELGISFKDWMRVWDEFFVLVFPTSICQVRINFNLDFEPSSFPPMPLNGPHLGGVWGIGVEGNCMCATLRLQKKDCFQVMFCSKHPATDMFMI